MSKLIPHSQRGITLIITFLVMTILLAIVLSISAILFNQIKMMTGMGDSVASFYASESGAEQALYFDRKQVPEGGVNGMCGICGNLPWPDYNTCDLDDLSTTASNGCHALSCNNCQITYTSTIGGSTYSVDAKVTPALGGIQDNPLNGVTYGNGMFVAVSYAGFAMSSPDGITWTTRVTPVNSWTAVTYGNGLFVAVADSGYGGSGNRVMTSPDGITWTQRVSAGDFEWHNVAYGNGIFVATSYEFYQQGIGRAMTSPNGIIWTLQADQGHSFAALTFGNGLFVAAGSGFSGAYRSVDGITWTPGVNNGELNHDLMDMAYGNGLYIIVGHDGPPDYQDWFIRSSDGINWTAAAETLVGVPRSIAFGNGRWVVLGFSGAAYSDDGINWTASPNAPAGGYWADATYGTDKFVGVPDPSYSQEKQQITYSLNGADWTQVSSGGAVNVTIKSKGLYGSTTRAVELNYTK